MGSPSWGLFLIARGVADRWMVGAMDVTAPLNKEGFIRRRQNKCLMQQMEKEVYNFKKLSFATLFYMDKVQYILSTISFKTQHDEHRTWASTGTSQC